MKHIFSTLCTIFLFILMLLFPQDAFKGASAGLLLWFHTVLPTLLPFIILSNYNTLFKKLMVRASFA